MKLRLPCPHCDRVFIGNRHKPWTLKGNLALHIKAQHPEHYVPKVKPVVKNPRKTRDLGVPQLVEPARRHYTPRKPKPAPESSVNYCPGCGTHLKAIAIAMNLS